MATINLQFRYPFVMEWNLVMDEVSIPQCKLKYGL